MEKVEKTVEGSHKIFFRITVPPEEPVGLVTKEGDVNWNCPCIGSMAIGPCGVEFREAFGCFHYRSVKL